MKKRKYVKRKNKNIKKLKFAISHIVAVSITVAAAIGIWCYLNMIAG